MIALRLILFALVMALCSPLHAQTPEQALNTGEISRLTVEVSNEIYSPFCPGKTLMMCPSHKAAKVRRDIQDMARDGKDKETIKNEIVAVYGEEFRLVEPPAEDNFALGGLIGLAFILAVVAVVLFSRKRRKKGSSPTLDEEIQDEQFSEEEQDYLDELRAHVQE